MEMDDIQFESLKEKKLFKKMRGIIRRDLAKQVAYVRGQDKEGRAVLIMHSRTEAETSEEDFALTQIYLMERAIAATEFGSGGREEMITAVFDFCTFRSSLAPSKESIKRLASVLQTCYSERLKKLIITDPPFWMRALWGIIKPFLHPVTAAKFIVVSGDKKKQAVISELMSEDQAMPFLLPSGKLTDEVDLVIYLKDVPFCRGYDRAFCPQFDGASLKLTRVSTASSSSSSDDGSDQGVFTLGPSMAEI